MRIILGNDHGGCDVKQQLIARATELGHTAENVGTDTEEIVRYPYFAAEVCRAVAGGQADRGILICSTGIGMSMIANKFRGIRAALCTDTYMAKMTRRHNDANVLCLGGKITGIYEMLDIVETWLATPYDGGRHDISLGLVAEAEAAMITGRPWQPTGPRR